MALFNFAKMEAFFAWLPIETLIYENRDEYYQALTRSNTEGESTVFIELMFGIIRDSLYELVDNQQMSAQAIADTLGRSKGQIERILFILKSKGILERVGANKSGYWKVKDEVNP